MSLGKRYKIYSRNICILSRIGSAWSNNRCRLRGTLNSGKTIFKNLLKKICYIFPKGRKKRWLSALAGNEPRDFFYGAIARAKENHLVKILENDDVLIKPRWRDWAESNLTTRICAGVRVPMLYGLMQNLQNVDWIIGVPDSIALALGRLSSVRRLNSRSMGFIMGLGDKIQRWEKRIMRSVVFNYYKNCLCGLDLIMCLGKPEADYLKFIYPDLSHKIHYIPFGIDAKFWSGMRHVDGDGYILFIGNDPNRDFGMLQSIAQSMPEFKFVWISQKKGLSKLKNVKHIKGNWATSILTDADLKKIYLAARMVILPLKDTLQPSGQSVCLQAMSCEVPVLLTRTRGIWDSRQLKNNENCIFLSQNALVSDWIEAIKLVHFDSSLAHSIGGNARKTVEEYWSSDIFESNLLEFLKTE